MGLGPLSTSCDATKPSPSMRVLTRRHSLWPALPMRLIARLRSLSGMVQPCAILSVLHTVCINSLSLEALAVRGSPVNEGTVKLRETGKFLANRRWKIWLEEVDWEVDTGCRRRRPRHSRFTRTKKKFLLAMPRYGDRSCWNTPLCRARAMSSRAVRCCELIPKVHSWQSCSPRTASRISWEATAQTPASSLSSASIAPKASMPTVLDIQFAGGSFLRPRMVFLSASERPGGGQKNTTGAVASSRMSQTALLTRGWSRTPRDFPAAAKKRGQKSPIGQPLGPSRASSSSANPRSVSILHQPGGRPQALSRRFWPQGRSTARKPPQTRCMGPSQSSCKGFFGEPAPRARATSTFCRAVGTLERKNG
mmetsp:Transcript_26234/g.73589  ORF Transcript_26234/g.73589 Transcript_26234/m.73589 type:complete len:365 (-) Transcript_26234:153-1247(-)